MLCIWHGMRTMMAVLNLKITRTRCRTRSNTHTHTRAHAAETRGDVDGGSICIAARILCTYWLTVRLSADARRRAARRFRWVLNSNYFFFIFFVAAYRNTLSTSMECSIREDWWIFIASSLLMTSAQINIKIVQCMVASTKNNIHFIGHVAASPTSISIQLKCRNST